MAFSLQARVVFPVDRPPIEHGVVTIEGARIVRVGKNPVERKPADLGRVAILPGLVNAHTHLEFSYLKQPLGQPGMSLVEWIRLVIAERGRAKESADRNSVGGIEESQRAGVTTIGNITTDKETHPGDITYFHEVIGFSQARAESARDGLAKRLLDSEMNPVVRQGISPHAPYTVSQKLLRELIEFAGKYNFPMAMHLAESREELQLLRDGAGPLNELLEERSMWDPDAIPRGSRLLDYLRMLSEAPRTLVIHGNYLDDEELDFLAAHRDRMSVVYCPRTHAYFFHPPYPLEKAVAAGVCIALGTDSRASNPDLSLLEEMRQVARLHYSLSPQQVLRMGTLDGAESLGRDRQVGSITPGKLANVIAVPLPEDAPVTPDEMLGAILHSDSAPSAVWIRGRETDAR